MKTSRDLDRLHPLVAVKARRLIGWCKQDGIELLVVRTVCDSEAQAKLYAIGREVEGPSITRDRPMGLTMTQNAPGLSLHEYGCAFDAYPIVDGRLVKTHYPFDWKLWQRVAELCQRPGVNLQWGGKLRPVGGIRELWHFHYSAGLTAAQLAAGATLPDVDIGRGPEPVSMITASAPPPAGSPKRKAAGRRGARRGK